MSVKDGLPSTDFSRMNREWVKAVAEDAGGGGGGGLPEITADDEGKVLTVESGAAAWATAGGGGSGIIVVEGEDGVWDITWQEVHDALVAGTPIVLKKFYTDFEAGYFLVMQTHWDSFIVYALNIYEGNLTVLQLFADDADSNIYSDD